MVVDNVERGTSPCPDLRVGPCQGRDFKFDIESNRRAKRTVKSLYRCTGVAPWESSNDNVRIRYHPPEVVSSRVVVDLD